MSPARQDLAAQPVPRATWVQRVQPGLLAEWAPQDNAVKRARQAKMAFRVLLEERALKAHAATQAIQEMRVQPAEPDKRDVKADKVIVATRVLQEPREQMAPSAPEARVLLKGMLATLVILAQLDA